MIDHYLEDKSRGMNDYVPGSTSGGYPTNPNFSGYDKPIHHQPFPPNLNQPSTPKQIHIPHTGNMKSDWHNAPIRTKPVLTLAEFTRMFLDTRHSNLRTNTDDAALDRIIEAHQQYERYLNKIQQR